MDNLIRRYDEILPSRYDSRDYRYSQRKLTISEAVDLREWDSGVEDQSTLGSCVGNAIASAYELMVRRLYPTQFVELSRLFVYYNSRLFDNTLRVDEGTYIRDGLRAAARYGMCTEKLWPYLPSTFDQQPTPECYVDGANRTVTRYETLYIIQEVLDALSDHKPVVTGMPLYSEFLQISPGEAVLAMPSRNAQPIGNHAVVVLGYDLAKQIFLAKNSFGTGWGDAGYFWIPFDYMERYVFERWCFDISSQTINSSSVDLNGNLAYNKY